MTQEQAIQRGFTHFIEVWRSRLDREGENMIDNGIEPISNLDYLTSVTHQCYNIYTVAIFLIKPKLK